MDYEKKYNEALERAKNLYPGVHEHNKKMLEQIFPELRESEDEKMMREFNDWLCEEIECRTNDLRDEKDRRTLNMLCYILTNVKDWLEKQKEPENASASTIIPSCWEYEQKEQKTAEKQDYSGLNDLERAIHRGFLCAGVENVPVGIIKETAQDCLAHLPVAWSEKDEKMIERLITRLNWITYNTRTDCTSPNITFFDEIDWLKSIRPSWKPSEEQMRILNWAANGMVDKSIAAPEMRAVLRELYDELLKLK